MRKLKRILTACLALTLVLAMAVGLSGCGGDKNSNTPNGANTDNPGEAKSDFTYVPTFTKITGDAANANFYNATVGKDCFYVQGNEVISSDIPEGVTPEYEGQYDVWGPVIYRISFDGTTTKLPYTALDHEKKDGVETNSNISSMVVADDGTLYTLESLYSWWSDAPEGVEQYSDEWYNYYKSSQTYTLRRFDAEMNELEKIDLTSLSDGDDNNFYPNGFTVGADGTIYIAADQYLVVLGADGTEQFRVEAENWVQNVGKLGDGTVVCQNYGSNGQQLSKVDMQAKSFGEAYELPQNAYNIIFGGGDYDIYYTNNINLYGYKFETGESTKLLNWLTIGIDNYNLNGVNVMEDGRVVTIQSDYSGTETESELLVLTKQPASSVTEKKTLTLATMSIDYNSRSAIINFNKTNQNYVIEVLDYSEYNTDDDYTAGLTKLTTELMTGNMPDILDLSSLPENQLAAKGMLEDLYPYIDNDPELSRDDIFESVRKALEVNGKLYTTCSGFSIMTVMGASSVVGDTPGWTVDEFEAALATMPEGCTPFDAYTTRGNIVNYMLALDIDSYVNWETGECNFDTDGFKKLLEFVNLFPETFDYENYDWSADGNTPERVASGKQMLVSTYLSDFSDYQMYKAIFGGKLTFIGYPTEHGTGNMISPVSGYAMSSKCSDKDAAWSFLRQFYTEDYQNKNTWYMPSNTAAFDKKLKDAMTPEYQKDENGNYILDENGNKVEVSQGGWGWGSVQIDIKAVTQEEADQILDLINTTTKVYKYDESISKIVLEEAAAYFAGQKSVDDVAKLIQSKVNIYVGEQR